MSARSAQALARVPSVKRAHVAALLTAMTGLSLFARAELPTQPSVAHGDISITTAGRQMTVKQTGRYGIVNWGSFSIGAGSGVHFNNGSGATLNRVTGLAPSQIDGSLTASGSLFLINKNGVIFGENGSVLTGGSFVASTRDVSDADFLDGGAFTLFGDSPAGITNLGKISSSGGDVFLAGYTVKNTGELSAANGRVGLVAGNRIDVIADASWLGGAFAVSLGERGNDVTNEGRIRSLVAELRTHNGNIYALAGNNSGLIQATGVRNEGGRVILTAEGGTVQSSGTISATRDGKGGDIEITAANVENYGGTQDVSGKSGGTIRVTAGSITTDTEMLARGTAGPGGTISLDATREILFTSAGRVDASGRDAGGSVSLRSGPGVNVASGQINVTSSAGKGGDVALLGNRVSLFGAAADASGATGGGTIQIGGGYQGATVQSQANSSATYISDKTILRADATGARGDGGTVVAWSDGTTQFAGTVTARSGTSSGNGGLVETSGLVGLGVSGSVDASARGLVGTNGQWLLDPKNITIGTVTDSMSEFQKFTQIFGAQPSETSGVQVDFGQYIDISGETLVVGAPRLNTAFVFEGGFLAARLTAPAGADFGEGVGVVGNIVAVFSGAENYFDGSQKPGVTHVYAKDTGWRNGTANRAMFFSNPSTFVTDYNGFGQSSGTGNNLRFSLGTMPNGSPDALLAIGNPDYGNGGNYGAVYTAVIPASITPSPSPSKGTFTQFIPTSPYNSTTNFRYGNSVTVSDGLVYVQSGTSNNSSLLSVINPGRNLVADFPSALYGGGLIAAENGLVFNVRGTQLGLLGFTRNDFGGSAASLSYNSGININLSSFASGATSIAYSGDTLMIGRGNDGIVNIYRRPVTAGWIGSTTIQPTQTVSAPGTGLGYSLAIDDDYAALGKNLVSSSRGEIETYRRNGEIWSVSSTLAPASLLEQTTFGQEIVADGNTNTLVIADQYAGDLSTTQSGYRGRVYVYENGVFAATLTGLPPSNFAFAGFGDKIAVNGNRIAVTNAFSFDGNTTNLLGRVQLFDKGTGWRNGSANRGWHYDFFGMIGSVALSGNTLAIGTPAPTFGQPGSVYIFPNISATSFGSSPITIQKPGAVSGVADNFGNSLALSGNTLAVGQPRSPSSGNFGANRSFVQEDYSSTGLTDYNIYLFENRFNNWASATPTLLSGAAILNPTQDSVGWGYSLALSGDTLVTGYHRDAPLNSSRGVYVFQRNGTWANSTTPVARLTGAARNFGFDVDIFNETIAVSSPNYLQNFVYGSPSGAHSPVYVFKKFAGWANGGANLVSTLLPATNVNLEPFGVQIALTSNSLFASSMINMVGASTSMSPIYQFNGPFEASSRASFGINPGNDLNISSAALSGALSLGTNITLQANNDITVSSPITVNNPAGNGGNLTLSAGRNVLVNASITTDNGNLTLIANAAGANASFRDAGERVVVLGRDSLNNSVTLTLGTGNLVIAAADRFENRTGATNPFRFDLTNPGRWVVYSTTPDQTGAPDAANLKADLDTVGRDWVYYNRTFNPASPIPTDLPVGDGFVYTVQPAVGVSVGNASITYGQAFASAPLSLGSLTLGVNAVSGAVFGISANDLPNLVNTTLAGSVSINAANGFANAGTYTGGITATARSSVTSGGVYGVSVSTSGAGTLTVAKKTLDVRPADATRVYRDANPVFTGSYNGFVAGDSISVLDTLPVFSTTAGVASDVGVYSIGGSGGLDNNYSYNFTDTGLLTVNQRDLALTGLSGVSRVYDATTAAQFTGTAAIAPLGGDNVTLSGTLTATASFASANVGSNKPLTFSGYSLSGAKAPNYRLVLPTTVTASITPATLALGGLVALDRDYDRTLVATLSGAATVSPLGTDSVFVSGTPVGAFANVNAGVAKPVTVSGLALSGPAASNYVLSGSGLSATIRPRALDVSGLVALDRVYDAGLVAPLSGTPAVTPLPGDLVSVSGTVNGSFADRHVGTDKPVTVSVAGLALSGSAASNYVLRSPSGLVADITPADLLVTGLAAVSRVYDATLEASLSGTAAIAPLGLDNVSIKGIPVATFADKDAGTSKPVTVTGYFLDGPDKDNYTVIQPAGLVADISPRALTLTGLVADDKTYDATTAVTVSGTAAFGGILPGDDATLDASVFSFSFADKHVGTAKPVAVSGLVISGHDAANYDITRATGFTASITPATLTISGVTALDRAYDATKTVALSGGTLSGVIGSDDIVFSTSAAIGTLVEKSAASTPRSVTASGYSITGADAANYVLVQPSGLTATISRATLNLVGLSADKIYDGNSSAPLFASGLDAVFSGDLVSPDFSAVTASYADKKAGVSRPVTLSGLVALSGDDAANYIITQPVGPLAGTIAPRAITVSGLTIANKTYDGTKFGEISGTGAFGGVLPGDDLAIDVGAIDVSFADANAGENKAITLSGVTLSGDDADNYTAATPVGLTATIFRRDLTVSGLSAASRVYDRTTVAAVTGSGVLAGVLPGESISLIESARAGAFADKNIGTAKPVTVTGLVLQDTANGLASNYRLVSPALAASITPAFADVTGLTAVPRVYDTTLNAPLSGLATLDFGALNNVLVSSESISLAGTASGAFTSKNIGTAKPVSVSGLSLAGTDAANYVLRLPASLAADVSRADLQVQNVVIASKTYDGTLAAAFSSAGSVTPLGLDRVTLVTSSATASFTDKTFGTAKPVTANGYTLSGDDAGNYRLLQPAGLTASISRAELRLIGLTADDKTYDGTRTAPLGGTLSIAPFGDDIVTITGAPSATFADKHAGVGKAVTVSGLSITGLDSSNYSFVIPALSATISPRNLAIGGLTATDRIYDGTRVAAITGTATLSGLVNGDDLSFDRSAISATFADKRIGFDRAVSLSGNGLTGADAANYTQILPFDLFADILAKELVVVGADAVDRAYDRTGAVALQGGVLSGAVPSDAVSLVSSTATGTVANVNAALAPKPVTVSGYSLSGDDAGNYTLRQPSGIDVVISPRLVEIAGVRVADKFFDGTTTAVFSGGTLTNVVTGDAVALNTSGGSAAFETPDIGLAKPVRLTGFALSGADAANYTLPAAPAVTGNIITNLRVITDVVPPEVLRASSSATLDRQRASLQSLAAGRPDPVNITDYEKNNAALVAGIPVVPVIPPYLRAIGSAAVLSREYVQAIDRAQAAADRATAAAEDYRAAASAFKLLGQEVNAAARSLQVETALRETYLSQIQRAEAELAKADANLATIAEAKRRIQTLTQQAADSARLGRSAEAAVYAAAIAEARAIVATESAVRAQRDAQAGAVDQARSALAASEAKVAQLTAEQQRLAADVAKTEPEFKRLQDASAVAKRESTDALARAEYERGAAIKSLDATIYNTDQEIARLKRAEAPAPLDQRITAALGSGRTHLDFPLSPGRAAVIQNFQNNIDTAKGKLAELDARVDAANALRNATPDYIKDASREGGLGEKVSGLTTDQIRALDSNTFNLPDEVLLRTDHPVIKNLSSAAGELQDKIRAIGTLTAPGLRVSLTDPQGLSPGYASRGLTNIDQPTTFAPQVETALKFELKANGLLMDFSDSPRIAALPVAAQLKVQSLLRDYAAIKQQQQNGGEAPPFNPDEQLKKELHAMSGDLVGLALNDMIPVLGGAVGNGLGTLTYQLSKIGDARNAKEGFEQFGKSLAAAGQTIGNSLSGGNVPKSREQLAAEFEASQKAEARRKDMFELANKIIQLEVNREAAVAAREPAQAQIKEYLIARALPDELRPERYKAYTEIPMREEDLKTMRASQQREQVVEQLTKTAEAEQRAFDNKVAAVRGTQEIARNEAAILAALAPKK